MIIAKSLRLKRYVYKWKCCFRGGIDLERIYSGAKDPPLPRSRPGISPMNINYIAVRYILGASYYYMTDNDAVMKTENVKEKNIYTSLSFLYPTPSCVALARTCAPCTGFCHGESM